MRSSPLLSSYLEPGQTREMVERYSYPLLLGDQVKLVELSDQVKSQ